MFWFAIGLTKSLAGIAVFLIALIQVVRRDRALNRPFSIACWIFAGASLFIGYAYVMEFFVSYYSANKYEGDAFQLRVLSGPYVWVYWITLLFQIILPQLLWPKYFHVRPVWPLVISGGSLLFSFF